MYRNRSEMDCKLGFGPPNSLKTQKIHFLGRKSTNFCSKILIFQTSVLNLLHSTYRYPAILSSKIPAAPSTTFNKRSHSTLDSSKMDKKIPPRVAPHLVSDAHFTTPELRRQSFVIDDRWSFESPKPVLFNGIFRFTNIFLSTKWQLCFWPRSQKSESTRGEVGSCQFCSNLEYTLPRASCDPLAGCRSPLESSTP